MLRFYNGRVLTMTDGCAISSDEVWVDDGKIAYVGPARTDRPEFDREIDLDGDLLLPGFKNAHAHAGMTFVRSLADDVPLQEWLFERIFPLEAKLTPEDVYAFTRLAILEYLTSGITAAFDMYFFREPNCSRKNITNLTASIRSSAISSARTRSIPRPWRSCTTSGRWPKS